MKKSILALALSLPALAFAQSLPTKEPAKAPSKAPATGPLATVNGVQIPRSRLDLVVRQQAARGGADNEDVRAQLREALINNELLQQEAVRTGLAKRPEMQQILDLNRQELLANAMVGEYLKNHPISDADVQKEYDRFKARRGSKEYRARHILVATEDEARAAIAEIKKGAKFDEVAQKRSIDEGTRSRGGDLDWNVPSNFDKAFADAMVKLEKGKMSEAPVRSRFGFHVIQIDDERTAMHPQLQQIRQQLQQAVVGQRIQVLIRELRAKAKIE